MSMFSPYHKQKELAQARASSYERLTRVPSSRANVL
jgi:hypothetical protein